MLQIIPFNCASCGSNLEITPDMETFACGYCGTSQIVERRGGTITLRPLTDAVKKIQIGTDRTAAELALKRLSKELTEVEQKYDSSMAQKISELETNRKLLGGLWLGGVVICVVVLSGGGTGSGITALLLIIVVTAGLVYTRYKTKERITQRFKVIESELFRKGNEIQRRIDENRKLVE
jgi:hypothetical protein